MSSSPVQTPVEESTASHRSVVTGIRDRLPKWISIRSLRRITASTKLLPQIDGIRFIAIFAVLLDHIFYKGLPLSLPDRSFVVIDQLVIGPHAVYLFFSLSGFILALPFVRQYLQHASPVDIKFYFRRRITRIEPPFVVALVLRLIAFLIFSATPAATILTHFFASLFYLHSAIYGPGTSISRPAWSLEVEIQFYILAPLLAMLFRVRHTWLRRSIVIALIFAVGAAARMPALLYNQRLAFSIVCNLQYFLAGFLACDLYVLRDFYRERSWCWDIAGIVCLLLSIASDPHFEIFVPIVNVAVILAAFYGRIIPRFLSLSFVSVVGGMCYSIYLIHNSVVTAVHSLLDHIPALGSHETVYNVALLFVSMTSILLVGTIFFLLVEHPCMDAEWPSKIKSWLSGQQPRRPRRV